jgi:hypothetical protein
MRHKDLSQTTCIYIYSKVHVDARMRSPVGKQSSQIHLDITDPMVSIACTGVLNILHLSHRRSDSCT